jgi:hypothetical protein
VPVGEVPNNREEVFSVVPFGQILPVNLHISKMLK